MNPNNWSSFKDGLWRGALSILSVLYCDTLLLDFLHSVGSVTGRRMGWSKEPQCTWCSWQDGRWDSSWVRDGRYQIQPLATDSPLASLPHLELQDINWWMRFCRPCWRRQTSCAFCTCPRRAQPGHCSVATLESSCAYHSCLAPSGAAWCGGSVFGTFLGSRLEAMALISPHSS